MKKSAIVVGNKYFIDYGYVDGQVDVYHDPYEVWNLSILCSLVRWIQVGYLLIYTIVLQLLFSFHYVLMFIQT